jgi:hypothetical protein
LSQVPDVSTFQVRRMDHALVYQPYSTLGLCNVYERIWISTFR